MGDLFEWRVPREAPAPREVAKLVGHRQRTKYKAKQAKVQHHRLLTKTQTGGNELRCCFHSMLRVLEPAEIPQSAAMNLTSAAAGWRSVLSVLYLEVLLRTCSRVPLWGLPSAASSPLGRLRRGLRQKPNCCALGSGVDAQFPDTLAWNTLVTLLSLSPAD